MMIRLLLLLIALAFVSSTGSAAEAVTGATVSYGQDIQPLLSKRCFACHGPGGEAGRVRLDRRDDLLAQGVVVPHKPGESELLRRITSTDPHERMPPKGDPLNASQIEQLRQWIAEGARVEQHWSFQVPQHWPLPAVRDERWSRNWIDRFVLAKLEQHGLAPAAEAERRALLRRVTFDLTGLPPTPDEIAAFLADREPLAYERVVDRLLASPHYGERAAQHWLDVVRFAETEGFEYDQLLAGLWRYRDYVIDALNADMPFAQFVTEQLAGDEIDATNERLRIAVGFHRLGPVRRNAGNPEVALSRNEVLTTRTDVIGSAFLGLTIGCARCHDHKFDPLSQRDYYRLQAFLAATDEHDTALVSQSDKQRWQQQTEAIMAEIKTLTESLKTARGVEAQAIEAQIQQHVQSLPAPLPCITSIRNSERPTSIHVLKRGEEDKRGEPVAMGVPEVFAMGHATTDPTAPRTRLARWLTDETNPLTLRVIVNRVWQQHFGTGLVATANDFGLHGEPPSHRELLDNLAIWFRIDGQSLKALHRLIVTSATYRQASRASVLTTESIDPDNRLLGRYRPQRLDAEALRDAMLAIAGRLNRKPGGESVVVPVDPQLTALLYKPSQWTVTRDSTAHDRRSIYLLAKRNLRLPFLETFDQPSLQNSCARRESSTHAPQALELLNGRWSNELADAFAQRLKREAAGEPERQIERAFELAAGRYPTTDERRLSREFLGSRSLREFALAMFNLNAFIYVD